MEKDKNKEQEVNGINENDANKNTSKTSSKKKKSSKKSKDDKALEELQIKLNESNDKFLRVYSEFDNYRKRTQKEKLELLKTASEEVIVQMLPVMDDFERALKAHEGDASHEGMQLIYNKFKNILELKGLKGIEAVGEPFDVDFHEAITEIAAPSEDLKGKVVDDVEKGYLLGDKVIRYSKVVVGK